MFKNLSKSLGVLLVPLLLTALYTPKASATDYTLMVEDAFSFATSGSATKIMKLLSGGFWSLSNATCNYTGGSYAADYSGTARFINVFAAPTGSGTANNLDILVQAPAAMVSYLANQTPQRFDNFKANIVSLGTDCTMSGGPLSGVNAHSALFDFTTANFKFPVDQ